MPKRNRTGLSQWVAEAAVPMLVLDRRSRVRVFNRGAQTLLGREAGEVLGQKARFTSDPDLVTAGSVAQQLAAIAPEPGQFRGAVTAGEIVLSIAGDVARLQAVFVPLQPPDPVASDDPAPNDDEDKTKETPTEKPVEKPAEDHLLVLLLPPLTVTAPRPASAHGELASRRVEQFHAGQTHRIVAASPAMQKPLRQLTLTRRTDASVHISGPPGSGRRTLARQVHADSLRAEQPLVVVSIARPLQPSQLREIRRSLQVEPGEQRAGTLVLADIDRLPRDAQRDLLDWLTPDDDTDDTERPRLVTTATRSLAELTADPDQPLRDDLAAELGTIGIALPPLSARAGDLPLLAQAIIERELHTAEREQPASISPAAMAELTAHHWPGHVGELDRCLTAAVAACETAAIEPADLPLTFRTGQHAAALGQAVPMEPIQAVLDAAERAHIEEALLRSGGRKAGAARLLGMTRPKLYRRIEALGIGGDSGPSETGPSAARSGESSG